MKAKLMSYNQIDLQSKAHMQMMVGDIEKSVEKYKKEMKEAGLVSYTLTQVWNKQGKHKEHLRNTQGQPFRNSD